jgi:SAM-dependent methyltransferase
MAPVDGKTIFGTLGRHSVHPFPARMAPEIVCSYLKRARRPLRVLDPMMGSGTVIALAQSRNHHAIGVDIDPLAALIARVWTYPVEPSAARLKGRQILERARLLASEITARQAYPTHADHLTKEFINYWFDGKSRRQVYSLSYSISRVRDRAIRELLWCAFSRLIISKRGASRALDLVHSRPHRFFPKAPVLPFPRFLDSVEWVLANVPPISGRRTYPRAIARLGDARKLGIPANSIDLVVTSPPYVNAIDYLRCSKFTLVWMGFKIGELTTLRSKSVGTEIGLNYQDDVDLTCIIRRLRLAELPGRQRKIIAAYISDMKAAIGEVARVLAPGGRAVYVIGENTIRGVYVRNSLLLRLLAVQAGLTIEASTRRRLPANRRYLPPPSRRSDAMDSRMRHEIVLRLRKA